KTAGIIQLHGRNVDITLCIPWSHDLSKCYQSFYVVGECGILRRRDYYLFLFGSFDKMDNDVFLQNVVIFKCFGAALENMELPYSHLIQQPLSKWPKVPTVTEASWYNRNYFAGVLHQRHCQT